jgi:formylglycine-generating enzyme required for sulfatase activity
MLTGRVPFQSDTPLGYVRKHVLEPPPPFRTVRPDLPARPEVESVVMKALAKDREQRYASVLDFAREFASAAAAPLPAVAPVGASSARREAERGSAVPAASAPVPRPPDVGVVREPPPHARPTAVPPAAPIAPLPDVGVARGVALGRGNASPLPPVAEPAPKPERPSLLPSGPRFRTVQKEKTFPLAIAMVVAAVVVVIVATLVGVYWPSSTSGPHHEAGAGSVRENSKDGLKYVWIPAGTFIMGCSPGDAACDRDEKPSHAVAITKGFWIGQTPVTVGAYKRFVGDTGLHMPPAPDFNIGWANENMPIVNVSWDDAKEYCKWMGGRLPTEAEWEFAARGGSTEPRYGNLDDIAWYNGNSGGHPHDVAQKRPNALGLYDTLGNVWQWVNDWYGQNSYQNSPSQDPQGPAGGEGRVLRGGSWDDFPKDVRVSLRLGNNPGNWYNISGFRCGGEVFKP